MIIEMDFSGGIGCSYCKFAITAAEWDGQKIKRKYKVCAHPIVEEAFQGQDAKVREIKCGRPRWCPKYKGEEDGR